MTDAYFNGYDAIELTVPSGATIRCEPLKMSVSARFHRLFDKIASGEEPDAMWEMMVEFPKAVGAVEEFDEHVHTAEMLQVVADFFGEQLLQKRNGNTPKARKRKGRSGSSSTN